MKDRLVPHIEQTPKKTTFRRVREYMLSRKFELSENTNFALLEAHLGIRFPFIPKKIIVTGENVAPHTKRYKGFKKEFGEHLGHYQYDIDGYFVPEDSSLYTELHENMHGFIGYINREFARSRPFAFEKEKTYKFVSEGICEWAATVVSNAIIRERQATGEDISDLIHTKRDRAADPYALNSFPDEPTHEQKISLIRDLTRLQTMRVYNEESKFEYDWENKQLSDKSYSMGFYFVTAVMNELISSGISINDALIRLISYPPTTFDKIIAPEAFAQTLLLTNVS